MAPSRLPGSSRVLMVECSDRPGLVHQITGVLFRSGVNIVGNQEFVDRGSGRFFMRTEFDGPIDPPSLVGEIRSLLPESHEVRLSDASARRLVILASLEHHCLADLLIRHHFGEFNARVLSVISNHPSLRSLVGKFDLPYHHVTADPSDREGHEAAILGILDVEKPDYIVLARYMRVLSPRFVRRYPNRILNIHHSFLPAFAGARPYRQAFERGVKVIGATAHFVTDELDAGPILVQQVIPVDHTHDAEELRQAGRDVEQVVLARALRLVLEDRVFLCGNRTILFE